ncbi:MAG: YciI family protein [Spirochaetaceae bacterium]|nr:MAG: YciI family protein [Spirochaetaceae bacterium]
MKVMVFVKASTESEAGVMPDEKLLTEMGRYNQRLVDAGILLDGDGLRPSSAGVRIRFSGSNRSVVDGPFAEAKELVAGYWVWNVNSMPQAIDWAKQCPFEDGEIELRPYFEPDDLGEAFTPELRMEEKAMSRKAAANRKRQKSR